MNRQEKIKEVINELNLKKKELIKLQTLDIVDNLKFENLKQRITKIKRVNNEIQEYVYFTYPIPIVTDRSRTTMSICGGPVNRDFDDINVKNDILKKYKDRVYLQCETDDIYTGILYNDKYKPL
jgi:DNA-directed RNA polymerase subunit H (RpoH/RPB5)